MHTPNPEIQMPAPGRRRGRYSIEFKRQVVTTCLEPGVSTAAIALSNGLNANMVRRWMVESAQHDKFDAPAGSSALASVRTQATFIPVRFDPPATVPHADIRIDVRIDFYAIYLDDSNHCDDASFSHALPGQSQHRGVELGAVQTPLLCCTIRWPDKFALMQSPRRQPDADTVVYQDFDAVGASVGKEVGGVRMGSTKYGYDTRQGGVGASSHVHGGCCQPDGIDADHLKDYLRMARVHCARSPAALMGQVTIIESAPLRSSTLMSHAVGSCIAVGSFKAMKAGAGEVASADPDELTATSWWHPFRSCSLSQRCSTLAFMPWHPAMPAMEAPGCWQAATNSALNWRV